MAEPVIPPADELMAMSLDRFLAWRHEFLETSNVQERLKGFAVGDAVVITLDDRRELIGRSGVIEEIDRYDNGRVGVLPFMVELDSAQVYWVSAVKHAIEIPQLDSVEEADRFLDSLRP